MDRDMKSRLDEVLEELEAMSDEDLASEIRAYATELKNYEKRGPTLGSVALQLKPNEEHDDEIPALPHDDEGSV